MQSKSHFSNRVTFASLLIALGIIYGDIGTSPLYVLKAIIGDKPISEELVLGGISCIFWTLLIQTTTKYIFLTLKADNHGEGGIFSLYALVRRYGKYLAIPTIIGATTLLADGIITPPISITSAVEGLQLISPDIPVLPIVNTILSLLFFFQRFGTRNVGVTFGPIMLIWFSMLCVLGMHQIIQFPEILKGLSPVYGYRLLVMYPGGFWLLGAVFLCTTGAEALYSDLGHCGRKNIRITWIMVKTCLLVNYLGQSAWVLHSAGDFLNGRNPFYTIMPDWFLISGILIATSATVIASQALISGSYTLISEAMSLNFWPRVAVRQPTNFKGQIYIPSVNNILWVGCILMVLYFRESAKMEAAYGFSITIAMLMTTYLLCYFLFYRLKWSGVLVLAIGVLFFMVESSFFIANIAKIKQRWMFLFFEASIFTVMYCWFYARKVKNRLTKFVEIGSFAHTLRKLHADIDIPKCATHLVYLTKANAREEVEDKIVQSIFARNPKRADMYWLLHFDRTDAPYTLSYDVEELVEHTLIKVNIYIGFRVQPRAELFFKRIIEEMIRKKEIQIDHLYDPSAKYTKERDFTFIVIERFLSVENEFTLREGLLLRMYFMLKRLGQKDEKAFGLDKSDVLVEYAPLVYQPAENVYLKRRYRERAEH